MAKALSYEVIDELRLTPQEFEWGNQSATSLEERVDSSIARASRKTKLVVGSGNYNSTDTDTAANLKDAEHALACAYMLRQRLTILSSRPEEAPPPEYIDLDALQDEIDRYLADWKDITGPYVTQDMDKPGTGFSFGSGGVDETSNDDYSSMDYGEL